MNESGLTDNSASSSGRNTERISEIVDFETTEVSVYDRREMDLASTGDIAEILNQLTGINSETKEMSATTGENTEKDFETTEVSVDDNRKMDLASKGDITEILDPLTGINSETKEMSATTEENTEEIVKMFAPRAEINEIMNQATENLEAETETETENTEILNAEVEKLKIASGSKRRGRKRKIPPTSVMVMESIKSLKNSNGASFKDIKKHMEEKYLVSVKALLKYNVNNFLQKCVNNGELEKISGTDTRFKIKVSK